VKRDDPSTKRMKNDSKLGFEKQAKKRRKHYGMKKWRKEIKHVSNKRTELSFLTKIHYFLIIISWSGIYNIYCRVSVSGVLEFG
jgi:hypothetical protein